MMKSSRAILLALLILCPCVAVTQQNKPSERNRKIQEFKSPFQVALFPGISTNGWRSGSYYNNFSLNIFGGLSAGSRVLEISPVSNVSLKNTTGIQLAGLANVVGANAFINLTVAEENVAMHDGLQASSKGIMFAGLLNYVFDQASGIQIAGALNAVGSDFKGVQVAGIGNSAGGFAAAFQFATLYNIGKESVAGVQISSLINYTEGQLSGTQVALINKSKLMAGAKSTPPANAFGLQVGIFNFSKQMDGVQIGLINFGGTVRGKQFGLINFFDGSYPQGVGRNGTPVGLLNFGGGGTYVRLTHNELFAFTLEKTTGNCLNCSRIFGSNMPFDDSNQIFNQNVLILGYDRWQRTWGFGYGFQKVLYNKFTIMGSPLNKKRLITYGLKWIHLNRELSFDHSFNLLNRLNVDYGKHWRSLYIFAGVSLNYFLHEAGETVEDFKIRSVTMSAGRGLGYESNVWPGYEVGLQF
jgi:hypothetical protein